MSTVAMLLRAGADLPGDSAARDTEILLGHVLDKPRTWLYTWPEKKIPESQVLQFRQLLERRSAGEPVAYLTGCRDFWTLSLAVNNHTLIPRPETETLVEWALSLPLPEKAQVADLGTGAGAIALALASERPGWQVCAVDASAEALTVARANAVACALPQVEFLLSDWFTQLQGRSFDLLVSNPPYIRESDEHLAAGDVRFEPRSALVSDKQGLGCIEAIISNAAAHLLPGGVLLLEHGYDQAGAVRTLLDHAGFVDVATRCDLAGIERISGGVWRAQ